MSQESHARQAAPSTGAGPNPAGNITEFTLRALLLGLIMCVVLGAANAYLGLRAGMTIAATYPAAVLSMAILRFFKGSLLEENFARTVGSIGESVAAGAIFTIPAFVILGYWKFEGVGDYFYATALMMLGGLLGILFVTILRRVMVEDKGLPFPESRAAAEIHRAGRTGAGAAGALFSAMGVGALVKLLDSFGIFKASNSFSIAVGQLGSKLKLASGQTLGTGGVSTISAPAVAPAYISVGYIIGPELGALNFAGGLLAWGLFVPLLVFFLGPNLIDQYLPLANGASDQAWGMVALHLYKDIVRPIAVGGMLVGACYTLWKMRANLLVGIKRGISDVKKSASAAEATERTERDLPFKLVLFGIGALFVLMTALYFKFTGVISNAVLAAIVIMIVGFLFAAVSGNLVGMIGSSNNPISGLTLATTMVAALTMLIVGAKGSEGVLAVLAVAAVGCVSSAVAGEMLQDLKVGHILGGTPWKMQVGNIIGVMAASMLLFFPLRLLHQSDIAAGGTGFGGANLPAPQAGLMAQLSQGIVGGEMAWTLVFVGIAMGIALILIKVKSPMLFSVGMYLPLETTFAIFCGGIIRAIVDRRCAAKGYNAAQKARIENAGVLTASGLIAGEALLALAMAGIFQGKQPTIPGFDSISGPLAIVVGLALAIYLIVVPMRKAGRPDEAAPPSAVM